MKRAVWILVVVFTLAACFALPCAEAKGNDFEYRIETDGDGTEYATLRWGKAVKNLVIPSEIDGYPVYEIGEDFARNSDGMADKLETLVIEPGVKRIGARAFQYCNALTTVTLPDGLEVIGESGFGDDMALTAVNFPEGLRSIGSRAFGWCRFSEANLPDSVEVIDDVAFCCVPLTSLRLGENVRKIGMLAFEYNHLTSLYIPASVQTVGSRAFCNSADLQRVIVAGEDTAFEPDAFEDEYNVGMDFELVCAAGSGADTAFADFQRKNTDLAAALEQYASGVGQTYREGEWACVRLDDGTGKIVDFPRNQAKLVFPASIGGIQVTVIGTSGVVNAEGYQKVASVVIPEGVTRIEAEAFRSFHVLKNVSLPSTLQYIGKEAFAHCSISSVRLPDGVEEIGDSAFSGNSISQLDLPAALKTVGDKAFNWCGIKKLSLPEGLEQIGSEAFWPFQGSSITIPASVRRIGSRAFGPNGSPKAWTVTFGAEDTVIEANAFGDDGNVYYSASVSYDIPKVTVNCLPGSTADLYFRYDCTKKYAKWTEEHILTSPADRVLTADALVPDGSVFEVIIPEGVEEIADGAFSNLKHVAKVSLPSTLKRIGNEVFAGSPLMEAAIPDGVEEIGDGAFRDCVNLSKVSFSAGSALARVGDEAFKSCTSLKSIALPKQLQEIGAGAFAGTPFTEATVPGTVTAIGESAFSDCESLTKLKLPDGLAEIPDRLCFHCRELKSVNIPSGVKRIGNYAFSRCRLISSLSFPEGLEEIGECAFEQFGDGAEMGWAATNGRETYTRLKQVSLPSTLKVLGPAAFFACDAVASVTFAPGCAITEIGADTFALCTHLKSVTLPDSVLTVGSAAFWHCYKLAKADLGAGLVSLGTGAFLEANALAFLTAPDTLKEIAMNALDGCSEKLKVTCSEGSAMEAWLQANKPDIKIVRPKN